jgi:hypothetical protein
MLRVRMDTSLLSLDELENISRALRESCLECVERGVPFGGRHGPTLRRLLDAMADAIDFERGLRERRAIEHALGVDPDSGEWLAGA